VVASIAYQLAVKNSLFAAEFNKIAMIDSSLRQACPKSTDLVEKLVNALIIKPLQDASRGNDRDPKQIKQVIIFIDAMDELLPNMRHHLLSALLNKTSKLSLIALPYVRLVISSRWEDDIVKSMCRAAATLTKFDAFRVEVTKLTLDRVSSTGARTGEEDLADQPKL
jgi:hypothetical protein